MSSNIFLIFSISSLSLRLVQIIRARCTNVDIGLIFRLRGLKDSQRKYMCIYDCNNTEEFNARAANVFCFNSWCIRGATPLTVHQKSCPGASRRFKFLVVMPIMAKKPSSHFRVLGKISSCGIALWARLKYVEAWSTKN